MSEEKHSDSSNAWLIFFFICFIVIMAIGAVAIFTYNANAPEPKPASSGGHSMLYPEIIPGQAKYVS